MRHSTTKGHTKNKTRLNEEKKNTGLRFNEPATHLTMRQTTTNSSRKQQHCCRSNVNIATHKAAATPAAAAALCIHIIYIYINWLLDCSDDTSIIIVHIIRTAAASAASSRAKKNKKLKCGVLAHKCTDVASTPAHTYHIHSTLRISNVHTRK